MKSHIPYLEALEANKQQIYSLTHKLNYGQFTIEQVGNYIPGNILITELNNFSTKYMNSSGCNILGYCLDELTAMGSAYFQKFFIKEEIANVVETYSKMHLHQQLDRIYTFTHRVKSNDGHYRWYIAAGRMVKSVEETESNKILLIVNEINNIGSIAQKINTVLEENDFIKANFKKFCTLTPKEKQIIRLVVKGYTSNQIAENLQCSIMTVNTHRRNIGNKLATKSINSLLKFALHFGLL